MKETELLLTNKYQENENCKKHSCHNDIRFTP